MNIKIVTDSTCDLPLEIIEQYGISVVPCYINVDGKSYLDGVDMTRQQFYERLPIFKSSPTTSAPGLGTFIQLYNRLAEGGATAIISIHISGTLSNVVKVAELAAREVTSVPVAVFDSTQLTLGTGLLVHKAARAAQAGKSLETIIAMLANSAKRTYTFAALDTLEFLKRSGRVSWLASGIGALLQLKPLLKMNNGKSTAERIRTGAKAVQRLLDLVTELGPLEHLSVVHTHSLERAAHLRELAKHLFPAGEPSFTGEVTPTIGSHIGPNAAGFVCIAKA